MRSCEEEVREGRRERGDRGISHLDGRVDDTHHRVDEAHWDLSHLPRDTKGGKMGRAYKGRTCPAG